MNDHDEVTFDPETGEATVCFTVVFPKAGHKIKYACGPTGDLGTLDTTLGPRTWEEYVITEEDLQR